MTEKPKNISLICISAQHPHSDVLIQKAEDLLIDTGHAKIASGLYLVETDAAFPAVRSLLNYGDVQNRNFGNTVFQVLTLEFSEATATLLSLPESVRRWLTERGIRVRSASAQPKA